jgi:hypothetical protein
LGGQHFADLFPRTRTDFDFDLIDMNDQSIIQIVKADLNDFDPGIVAEAGEMLLSYVSNPDLCHVRKLGPCPPPLLSEFLAVAPWRDLRLLLYDLRGQRQQVRSYAFFATYAAQKILRIPPEVFAKARAAKARAALSSLPGKRQAKKTTGYALDSGSPNSLWFAPEQCSTQSWIKGWRLAAEASGITRMRIRPTRFPSACAAITIKALSSVPLPAAPSSRPPT